MILIYIMNDVNYLLLFYDFYFVDLILYFYINLFIVRFELSLDFLIYFIQILQFFYLYFNLIIFLIYYSI